MKITFVAIGVESLAIEFLSGYLKKKGFEVDLVFDPRLFASEAVQFKTLASFFDTKKEIVNKIMEKKPDVVGFSVLTINYRRALEIAKEIKRINPHLPIIFGGIHPTCVPEIVIKEKCVDIICVGEGEKALVELLTDLKNNGGEKLNIKNLWFKKGTKIIKNPLRPLIKNLDSLPFPDKELFYKVYSGFIKDDYYALSSRGCPFSCTYCGNSVWQKVYQGLGKKIRRRSPKNIISELVLAKEKFNLRQITFVDDVFGEDTGWLKEFSQLYKKRVRLPYVVITHPIFITSGIVKYLISSGCYFLLFGVQTASEKTRFKILGRYETNQQIEKAAKICHLHRLSFSIDHIFNLPGEGVKEYLEAFNFYNKIRPSVINSYWLQYFPKTPIIKTAVKNGLIKKSDISKIENGETSTSLVVGLGSKDSFNTNSDFRNFQFLFNLLPVLPRWLMNKIIKEKFHQLHFRVPLVVNVGVKFLINLIRKRGNVYLGIIKSLIHFSVSNLFLKWQSQNLKKNYVRS